MYFSRYFKVRGPSGKTASISDAEFATVLQPKVILGAPGGGKSKACEEIVRTQNGKGVHAEELVSGFFTEGPDFQGQVLVVDGLDEVISEEIPKAFLKILRTIMLLKFSNWVISCRAYEWRTATFEGHIRRAFGSAPMIAHIVDLTEDEVMEILPNFGYPDDPKEFVLQAKASEAAELLGNPQTLKMLSQAVKKHGWPTTKTDLYQSACELMAEENNEVHQEASVLRPSIETTLSIAGWICAQLLMSGTRGISLVGEGTENAPRTASFSSKTFTTNQLVDCCKTKLFRVLDDAAVEPVHRTVAEFLAGRWLAQEFRANPRNISPLRVLNYLASGTDVIPPALRGLHAWLTSFEPSFRRENTTKDPYGCLRYGDLSQFSDDEVRHLLGELQKLAAADPYFRSQDWHTQFGQSIARLSLKNDFVRLVTSRDTPHQLSCTLMDAMAGSSLADELSKELIEVLQDDDASSAERHSAYEALAGSQSSIDWRSIAAKLLSNGSTESLRVSLELISDNPGLFTGSEVSEHIQAYERATAIYDGPTFAGVGWQLPQCLSEQQVTAVAKSLAAAMLADDSNAPLDKVHKGLEEWLLEFLPRVLSQGEEIGAQELWSIISVLSGHSYRRSDWEETSQIWFGEHDDIRREMQALAFDAPDEEHHGWLSFHQLSDISPGLHLRESDVKHHLKRLLESNGRPADWKERWRNLVQWARMHRDFDGSAIEFAQQQAFVRPDLKKMVDEVLAPQKYEEHDKWALIRSEQDEKRAQRDRRRLESFTEVREAMRVGRNLGALHEAACAALGYFVEFKRTKSPADRMSELVGSENLEAALQGFEAAAKGGQIPSVRNCAELRNKEGKHYYLETICLALCTHAYQTGQDLTELPREVLLCALSGCRWGLHFHGNESAAVEVKLEEIIYTDWDAKLNFVRDSIEPQLEVGKDPVSGLHRVTTETQFESILSKLALDWLAKFPDASASSVWTLLQFALRCSDREKLIQLISKRLSENIWSSVEHKSAWHSAAFVTDFDLFHDQITSFASEDKDRLWNFRKIISSRRDEEVQKLKLNVQQLSFLVRQFAILWPVAPLPNDGWNGDHNPWNAAEFLRNTLNQLANEQSQEAIDELEELIQSGDVGTHQESAQNALANAKRAYAEAKHSAGTLEDVRKILLSGKPTNVGDLQQLFLEEFALYQARIRTGQTDSFLTFWEGEKPQIENFCRDRLIDGLEERLGAYGVRTHKEGAMANETRVDLLLTCDDFDLPVEIKRQWHPKLWSAACNQLETYSQNYRTDGTGVYLVIWHGYVKGKSIPRPPKTNLPKNAAELQIALNGNLPKPLSAATKLVVLDVSKPPKKKKKAKGKVNTTVAKA